MREIISAKTAIALPDYDQTEPSLRDFFTTPNSRWDEFPPPLVHWVEPEGWARYRKHAEKSKPVLHQLRRELRFFLRCYAFLCGYVVVPCLALILLPWLFSLGPLQVVTVSIRILIETSVLAIFITMVHWFHVIHPVPANSEISFRERGITQRFPSRQVRDWSYRQFSGWTIIEREFKGRILQILVLKRAVKGLEYNEAFALPDDSVRDQVAKILNDKQVPQASDVKPSWEAD